MNTAQAINGELKVGDWVIAAPSDEYAYLIGVVTAIDKLGTPEHNATDNDTDDVHVDFYAFDYPPERIKEIEELFSDLFDEPKEFDDLPLGDTIMAPDDLIRITELGETEINRMGSLLADCEAFCSFYPGKSNAENHAKLMERLEQNLMQYHDGIMALDKRGIIEQAGEIHAVSDAYSYMTSQHDFSDDELNFYLQFKNPLEIVANEWEESNSKIGDLIAVMEYIGESQDDYLMDYPLIGDTEEPAPESPAHTEATEAKPADKTAAKPKTSIEDRLRAAQEKVDTQTGNGAPGKHEKKRSSPVAE